MSLAQMIPLNINSRQKLKIILENVVRMLTNRGFLKKTNLEKNIQTLTSKVSDDNLYTITSDRDEFKGEKFLIKFILQKITAISKSTGIVDFLNSSKSDNKIVVVSDISKKAIKQLNAQYPKTEVFKDINLMIDLAQHELFPEFQILSMEEKEDFERRYSAKKRHLPKMFKSDPAAKYYNMQIGDICKIVRKSVMTGKAPAYRIIIPAPMK